VPEAWNMRLVLGVSTVLGVIGVVAAFGLFYLGLRVFHLDHAQIQTMMYLKLSVAGHLTIFLTRTRGPFWSIRPARILWVAVLGTQTLATLIAVYGVFMTPLGWGWALFVWGYALAWFLVNDRIKLLAYRILDRTKAGEKPVNAAEAKTEGTVDPKATPKTAADAKPNPEVMAKPAAQPSPQPKAKAKPESQAQPDSEDKAVHEAAKQPAPQHEDVSKADPTPESGVQPKGENKAEPEAAKQPVTQARPEVVPEPETKADAPELPPQLVKRVHAFYEELGRDMVRAVEASEQTPTAPHNADKP